MDKIQRTDLILCVKYTISLYRYYEFLYKQSCNVVYVNLQTVSIKTAAYQLNYRPTVYSSHSVDCIQILLHVVETFKLSSHRYCRNELIYLYHVLINNK